MAAYIRFENLNKYSYSYLSGDWFWTMSAANETDVYISITSDGKSGIWGDQQNTVNTYSRALKPVVSLNNDVTIKSGNGTEASPYIIE